MNEDGYELHKMPNGTAVWYQDSNHAYHPMKEDGGRGRRCLGVTTPVKAYDGDPDGLLRWAARMGYIGVAELAAPVITDQTENHAEKLSWLTSQDSIIRKLNEAGLDFESVRNKAGQKGSTVHEVGLQALAMGRPVPDPDAYSEEEAGYIKAVMKFWLEWEPQVSLVEQVVYSERLGCAGRLDLFARLKGDDRMSVIDAKTGKFISDSAHVQVGGGYPCLLQDAGFLEDEDPVPQGWILHLKPDGEYDLIKAHGTPAGFELAVLVHKEKNRIKREARNARDRITVDRKLAAEIDAAIEAHGA